MRLSVLLFPLVLAGLASAASKADLTAKTIDGQKVHLKDLRGKLVVLNFWATWCEPCRAELPLLVKAAQANANVDLAFIAISVDEPKSQVKIPEAVRQYGITFPVWVGANGDDLYRLSKREAVPATVFLDRDGTVQSVISGQIRAAELIERIDWLTSDRKGTKPPEFVSHVN